MVKTLLFSILVLTSHCLWAQSIATGIVMDADEHPIAGVLIEEMGSVNSTYSELDGSFCLHFFGDNNQIKFSHSQFDTLIRQLKIADKQKVFMNLKLGGNSYTLEGYGGFSDFAVKNPNKHFENMPYFFGESDVNKQLQMLPGVEHGMEVLGNLYVRGGDVDQNLFMYNGTPIYNYNHLFGITNIFHQRSIGNTSIHKGISPASEGGRLSSVINLESSKDSKYSGLDGEFEISPLNAGLFIESITKDKSYFTLGLRRSWIDLLLPTETRQNDLNVNFHDVQLNFGFGH